MYAHVCCKTAVARIDAISRNRCSSGLRIESAQLVNIKYLRKRGATDRGNAWDRFVAECGLYCLPNRRRFELAEKAGRENSGARKATSYRLRFSRMSCSAGARAQVPSKSPRLAKSVLSCAIVNWRGDFPNASLFARPMRNRLSFILRRLCRCCQQNVPVANLVFEAW
jgi:hypothetical protein